MGRDEHSVSERLSGDNEEFMRLVRDALTYLYDHAHLQRHPLARLLVPAQAVMARTRAQELRRILLDGIEALNPGNSVAIRAVERRPYAILYGLYVEGRDQQNVATSLSIGDRQLRRDRAAALEALASILRDRHLGTPAEGSPPGEEELLRSESERLAQQCEPVDLSELVDELLPLLQEMAHKRGVSLLSHVNPGLPQPSVNRTLVRQILIGLASQGLTTLPLRRLSFEVRVSDAVINLGIGFECCTEHVEPDNLATLRLEPVETLTAALGGHLLRESRAEGKEIVWVSLPRRKEKVVLVVDDNEELFELFQRYVVGQPYRLVHAPSADQALALVHTLTPDIITLDLMMPNRDGWELLQTLRAVPVASRTPVIVCSVLEEPDLALSLGAQVYLKKPIERVDLLRALKEVEA